MYSFTNGDWKLFEVKGVNPVIKRLNISLEKMIIRARRTINQGFDALATAKDVRNRMYCVMDKYSHFGARDTEPETFLIYILERELNLPSQTLMR